MSARAGSLTIAEVRTEDDLAAIRALCSLYREWMLDRFGENRWVVLSYYTPEAWAAVLDSLPELHRPPEGEMLLARLDGQPVGCVMMQKVEDEVCELKRLFVHAEAQGQKVGRRLCEDLMRIARERGYRIMRLDTAPNQTEALGLYRALGFQERGPYYDPPAEVLPWLVFMEADLAPRR